MPQWQGGDEDLMIALHARRSAASVAAWRHFRHPQRPAAAGADRHRPVPRHRHDAAPSTRWLAERLVVLHDCRGAATCPNAARPKAAVCCSRPGAPPLAKTGATCAR
jgi:hypothetical protein